MKKELYFQILLIRSLLLFNFSKVSLSFNPKSELLKITIGTAQSIRVKLIPSIWSNEFPVGNNFFVCEPIIFKNFNFIGKDALLKIKDKPLEKTMMMFTLKDSKPGEPLLLHEEPIYLDDKIIGRTTSGNYSFCFDKNLSFGYVNSGNTIHTLKDKNLFIEVEKIKYPVEILSKPLNTKDFRKI